MTTSEPLYVHRPPPQAHPMVLPSIIKNAAAAAD